MTCFFVIRNRRRNTLKEVTWKKNGEIMFSDEVSTSTNPGPQDSPAALSSASGRCSRGRRACPVEGPALDVCVCLLMLAHYICSGCIFLTVSSGRQVRWYFRFINKETEALAAWETDLIITLISVWVVTRTQLFTPLSPSPSFLKIVVK